MRPGRGRAPVFAARTGRGLRALHVLKLDARDGVGAREFEIAREVRQPRDLRRQRERLEFPPRRERDAVAVRVRAVAHAFGHFLDLDSPEAVGRPLRGVPVGCGEHDPRAAEPEIVSAPFRP